MRFWLVFVAGAIPLLFGPTAASPARADQPGFQRLASKAAAHVSANFQAVWADFGMSPSEAKRLGHRLPGIRGVYSHVTPAMQQRITQALQARWNANRTRRLRAVDDPPHAA